MPDVLVKGGDYKLEEIVGAKEVVAAGGKVVINPILPGFSTTSIINKISK
jgi:D-beta-D-heptose 7-phosphate kinase/D-beta-D-heptose 1-phosphate adenosyltransferase